MRKVVERKIVEKLRGIAYRAFELRQRFNAAEQTAGQLRRNAQPVEREREQLVQQIEQWRPHENRHPEVAERLVPLRESLAKLDAWLAANKTDRERTRAAGEEDAQRSSAMSDLVNGVLRELGVSRADLGIDLIDNMATHGGAQ